MANEVTTLIRTTPLSGISVEMLRQLVSEGVSESQDLEFKEQWSRDAMEQRKDAVAMTNGGGGTIIYGIKEDGEHRAESFRNIADAVKVEEQIHASLITKIDPTLRFELCRISVDNNTLILLRVEAPDSPPHCLEVDHRNRQFPTRQNRDTRPMTMDEIRNAMHGDQLRRDVSMIREAVEKLGGAGVGTVPLDDLSLRELVTNVKDSKRFADELLKRL